MPKVATKQITRHISFSEKTYNRLMKYINKSYRGHRVLSALIQQAIDEYLDRHENE